MRKNPPAAGLKKSMPETLYDFALPVYRQARSSTVLELLSSEILDEQTQDVSAKPQIMGVIQVGLTTAYMQKDLNRTVWKIGWYTLAIIGIGIVLTLLLAHHIIAPLQQLAKAARRFGEGEPYTEVTSDALDEVGQLTRSINTMALTLQQREESISTYVDTITEQLNQLSTLHQTGTIITSTLDEQKLFATVLKLLRENLGFQRWYSSSKIPNTTKESSQKSPAFQRNWRLKSKVLSFPLFLTRSMKHF